MADTLLTHNAVAPPIEKSGTSHGALDANSAQHAPRVPSASRKASTASPR